MKKIFAMFAVLSICLGLTSCATLFGNKNRTVNVNSVPPGAKVFLNNTGYGKTPASVVIGNPLQSHVISVKKAGYEPVSRNVETQFQMIGLLNILFWPGFIIDAITGDMMKITTTDMNIKMTKASK